MFDRIKAMFPTAKPKQLDKLSADKMARFKRLRKFAAKRMEGHARIEYLSAFSIFVGGRSVVREMLLHLEAEG